MLSGLLPESSSELAALNHGGRRSAWPTLLVVDPDADVTRTLVCFFEKRGFHVAAATTLTEAKEYFHRCRSWTLVITDYHLPDGSGMELCDWLREQGSDIPVLLISGSPYCSSLCMGQDYMSKPLSMERLEAYVRAVQKR